MIDFSVYISLRLRRKKIDVKVNCEAQSSLVCIFLFYFYNLKKKNKEKQNIFLKICCIIKINAAKQGLYFLMRAVYYERKINYTWPKVY